MYNLRKTNVPAIVYTMAKVASSSIYLSVKNQSKIPAFHVHTLDIKKINEAKANCKKNGVLPDSRTVGGLIYLNKLKPKLPVKIITSVRNPIDRNVSAFFEVFKYYMKVESEDWKGSLADLQNAFFEKIPHDFPLVWFDKEFKKFTKIDVFENGFPFEQKFEIYNKENVDVLLLRTDLEDEKKQTLIANFLNIENFKLQNRNLSADKKYAKLYQNFKDDLVLPKAYLDKMLNAKFTKQFYSKNEIDKFYNCWK